MESAYEQALFAIASRQEISHRDLTDEERELVLIALNALGERYLELAFGHSP